MEEEKRSSFQPPRFELDPTGKDRQAWVDEQCQESEGWMENQSAYKNFSTNLNIFDAIIDPNKQRSALVTNSLKYNIRKFVEAISDVKEIGSYRADAEQFGQYADVLNKVARGVYLEAQFPRQIRKVLQYSSVMGRGYIWPKCKAGDYGYGERQIVFEPLGLLDVLPIQIPSTNDVQDAYAVTVYEYMPIAEAHARWPLNQSDLHPVNQMSYRSRVSARRVDTAERFRYGGQKRNWGNLNCELRYTYVRDMRINSPKGGKTGMKIPMGTPGTSWFYEVPYVGEDIVAGVRNGAPFKRPAMPEDCRVYPFLRLIISSRGMDKPLYDGPAFDWHGKIPVVQYDVDDWAWEAMGRSLVQDVGSIQTTKRMLERRMDQVIKATLNPPMGYDDTATGGPKIENFDLFEEDIRAGVGGEPDKIFKSILPDSVKVQGEHFKFWELLDTAERKQLGIDDLGNLANLKLNLSGENIDKALEAIGPIAKGIATGMEASNAKLAFMLKFMIPQWYDTKRIIEYVGANKVAPQIFDFDPDSMIPSHMPDEYKQGIVPTAPSNYDKIDRARRFAKNLRLVSVPSTLLELTQQAERMVWMSLKFKGAPLSWHSLLKKCGIEDIGDIDGVNEYERWKNETIEEIKFKAQIAMAMQQMGLGGDDGGKGQGKGGGRPPSGKKPMKQQMKGSKGGEPRVVNRES